MQKSLISLANVSGLDINNSQHTVALADAVKGVQDIDEFVDFVRDHKDGIEFTSRPERLDILAQRYRAEKAKSLTAQTFAQKLDGKVRKVKNKIKNHWAEGKSVGFCDARRVDGEPFFTVKELRALYEVGNGSTMMVVELCERDRLVEEIEKAIIDKKSRPQIVGHKKVGAIAKSAARGMA